MTTLSCMACGNRLDRLSKLRYRCSNPECNSFAWIDTDDNLLYNHIKAEATTIVTNKDQSLVIRTISDTTDEEVA